MVITANGIDNAAAVAKKAAGAVRKRAVKRVAEAKEILNAKKPASKKAVRSKTRKTKKTTAASKQVKSKAKSSDKKVKIKMKAKVKVKGTSGLASVNWVKFLKRKPVKERLCTVAANAIDVLKQLAKTTDDETIANKLKCKVSDVRSTLNKLHELGVVSYNKTKNQQNGWYTYSWFVNPHKFEEWLNEEYHKLERLLREGGEYYVCPVCGATSVYDFSKAYENNFKCPVCQEQLDYLTEDFLKKRRFV